MKTIKGEIIDFISKKKKPRSKDITNKFGSSGSIHSYIAQLKNDGIIKELSFECGTCKYFVIK